MLLSYCKSESCINDLLRHVMESGDRMTKESPVASYEMIGRLFIVFGVVCKTAGELYELEKESRRTFLDLMGIDYERYVGLFEAQRVALKRVLGRVPLFRDRDYQKYPQVAVEDVLSVKEEFLPLEQLPFCGNRKAQECNFDATRFAYMMHDMIFLGLEGIVKFTQGMHEHQQMLSVQPEMRAKRWQRMIDDYREHEWEGDKQLFLKRRDDHVSQYGCDKTSLTELMKQIDNEATNQLFGGMVATLNYHYLHHNDHVTYVFENRGQLTREHIIQHLKFIHIHKLLEQEIALCDLRQPAVGAYADLFTSRAAQELAMLLAPVIAKHVDFRHNYHYAAWAMAMRDMGLLKANKRNGTTLVEFINKTFHEQIDKSTLLRYMNKDDCEIIRDLYETILSVVRQEMDRDPRLHALNAFATNALK
ncbi:MAG: hypothetical protein IK075_07265 [Prevotella sp.]|nr:hypothetical protein [Prevotella sp.]